MWRIIIHMHASEGHLGGWGWWCELIIHMCASEKVAPSEHTVLAMRTAVDLCAGIAWRVLQVRPCRLWHLPECHLEYNEIKWCILILPGVCVFLRNEHVQECVLLGPACITPWQRCDGRVWHFSWATATSRVSPSCFGDKKLAHRSNPVSCASDMGGFV